MIKTFATALLVAGGLAFAVAPAAAADLIVYDDPLPMTDVGTVSVDWEGAYVGVGLGYYPTFGDATISGEIGFNFLASENILLGVSGSGLLYLDGSNDTEFYIRGRAGVVFDRVALYGMASLGVYNFGTALWDVGAGIEVMVADGFSVFGEGFLRDTVGNIPDVPHVQAGVRLHF